MDLPLTDEQVSLLLAELDRIINDDRFPLSPRIRVLRGDPRAAEAVPVTPAAGAAAEAIRAAEKEEPGSEEVEILDPADARLEQGEDVALQTSEKEIAPTGKHARSCPCASERASRASDWPTTHSCWRSPRMRISQKTARSRSPNSTPSGYVDVG